jgi:hypothetical protein
MGFQPMLNDFHLQFASSARATKPEAHRFVFHADIARFSKISWHRERRAWIRGLGASFENGKCLHGLEAHVTDALLPSSSAVRFINPALSG